MTTRRLFSALSLFALSFLVSAAVFAQGTTSRIGGVVTDNAGAAVPGATVTLLNPRTNATLVTTTNDDGSYVFDLINPGTYTVTIEKPGFKKAVSNDTVALVNQPASLNVTLEVGDISAVVNVESSTEAVQTSTSGNVGSTIEQRAIESL